MYVSENGWFPFRKKDRNEDIWINSQTISYSSVSIFLFSKRPATVPYSYYDTSHKETIGDNDLDVIMVD